VQWRSSGLYKASGLICGEQDSSSVLELIRSLVVALLSEKILVRSVGSFLIPLAVTGCVMLSVLDFRLCWSKIYT